MSVLTQFLSPEHIYTNVLISSKKRALEFIGKTVAESLNQSHADEEYEHLFCPVECFSNLFKREKLGSTALNNGIALPHAKLPGNSYIQLDKPIAIFIKLENPIDYAASDHKEVDLIYAILFPEQSCCEYKTCLPQIAERLTDKNILKQLRMADSADDIFHILRSYDEHLNEENIEAKIEE